MEARSQKLFWATNLTFLRKRKKMSQGELAQDLGITRAKLNSHENGLSKNPPLEDLLVISAYFKLAVDTILKIDLSKIGELKLRELESGNDVFISGGNLKVLAITVNSANKENMEYVPLKAKAGYLAGYNDPQFIEHLPKFTLPHLPENKTFRMFPTEGDSMLPIPENCLVITEYVSDWTLLKETPCVVIMESEQTFLFKIVSLIKDGKTVLLHSLNTHYQDKEIYAGDIKEIWKYNSHITDAIPTSETTLDGIMKTINEIQLDMKALKLNINSKT